MTVVYTIGHSNRTLNDFIKLLKSYSVEAVIDVRRFPKSTKYPHFNREVLSTALEIFGIRYYWLGRELGGFRKEGYEAYMRTSEYRAGIMKLLEITRLYSVTAVMCSEKFWFRCHRRFIARTLREYGLRVIHIVDFGEVRHEK